MILRFGEFEVDMALFQLRRANVQVKLERLVFDAMVYLIEERRRVVLRHQLVARLWPRETVVASALARVVSTLRTALHDDAVHPRYIETIRGRGYRFIHPVQAFADVYTAPPMSPTPAFTLGGAGVDNGNRTELDQLAAASSVDWRGVQWLTSGDAPSGDARSSEQTPRATDRAVPYRF